MENEAEEHQGGQGHEENQDPPEPTPNHRENHVVPLTRQGIPMSETPNLPPAVDFPMEHDTNRYFALFEKKLKATDLKRLLFISKNQDFLHQEINFYHQLRHHGLPDQDIPPIDYDDRRVEVYVNGVAYNPPNPDEPITMWKDRGHNKFHLNWLRVIRNPSWANLFAAGRVVHVWVRVTSIDRIIFLIETREMA